MSLNGKAAIVTGSGRGLGLAYAQELARQGASVVINDVDAAIADSAVESIRSTGGNATAVAAPVGSADTAQALVVYISPEKSTSQKNTYDSGVGTAQGTV